MSCKRERENPPPSKEPQFHLQNSIYHEDLENWLEACKVHWEDPEGWDGEGWEGWGGLREGGWGWGPHVNPWLIHVNVWQKPLQYCKVISLQLIKINEKKKAKPVSREQHPGSTLSQKEPCKSSEVFLTVHWPVRIHSNVFSSKQKNVFFFHQPCAYGEKRARVCFYDRVPSCCVVTGCNTIGKQTAGHPSGWWCHRDLGQHWGAGWEGPGCAIWLEGKK